MKTDEQGIITMLQEKISEHEEKIKSYRQAISALGGRENAAPSAPQKTGKKRGRKPGFKKSAKQSTQSATPAAPATNIKRRGRKARRKTAAKAASVKSAASKSARTKKSRGPRKKETLESWTLKQFADDTPKTNRTLLDLYNKSTGKNLDMNGFAARISMVKKKGNLVSAKNAADGINYTGKANWFEKGKLKKPYLSKIAS